MGEPGFPRAGGRTWDRTSLLIRMFCRDVVTGVGATRTRLRSDEQVSVVELGLVAWARST